jgi:hypothetical protein
METNKIVLIVGLIFILFFIMRNIKIVTSSPTTTTTTKSTVVYRKPVTPIAGPNPHYNSYKSQYYN